MATVTWHCMIVLCDSFFTKFARKFCEHTILDTLVRNEIISFLNNNN